MSKRLAGIAIVAMILFGISGLAGCSDYETYAKGVARIESISKIELPKKEIEIEYHYYYKAPHGDISQYTVMKFDEEPTEFLQNNSFSDPTRQKIELYTALSNIPKEFHPDWAREYQSIKFPVYDRSLGGTMLYFPDIYKLIVVIEL